MDPAREFSESARTYVILHGKLSGGSYADSAGVPYRVFVAAPAHAQWMGAVTQLLTSSIVMQLLTSSIDVDLVVDCSIYTVVDCTGTHI